MHLKPLLTNSDIDSLMKRHHLKYNGCYFHDDFPEKDGWFVLNMDKSGTQGTHWVSCLKTKGTSIYFDSFGICPQIHVAEFLKNYIYNTTQIQDEHSTHCGYFCVAFIKYCQRHQKEPIMQMVKEFVAQFDNNLVNNDLILEQIFSR